jgi:glutamate-1-semialdehyde 2,1-aminomutase
VIGGGLPIAAFGGRADVMACLAPVGPVYQAGTLSGNPVAAAAGLAALGELTDDAFKLLAARAERLGAGLHDALAGAGIAAQVPVVGPLVGLHFSATRAVEYDTARTTDTARYAAFFHALMRRGVAIAPGPYEVVFPGLAHDDAVIERVIEAAYAAAREVASS